MTFERSWVLLLALLPLVWAAWNWRRGQRRWEQLLKALALVAILLALAEPGLDVPETKMAVSVLVDTSASVSAADLEKASAVVSLIRAQRGRHQVRVVPFARSTRGLTSQESASAKLAYTQGEPGRGTDLEGAVREALAASPAGMVPRLVLISDGQENKGSVTRAAWQAGMASVPVDTIPLAGRPRPDLRLESVVMPSTVFTGERFPIEIAVNAPRRAAATVEVAAGGKPLGSSGVSLVEGLNQISVHASINESGAYDLLGSIRSPELGEVRFAQAVTLRRPKVLFLSQDPQGSEKDLFDALAASQFDMRKQAALEGVNLADYQIAVLNNWDLEGMPPASKAEFEDFVKQGGGLLVIGGERNIYVERREIEDPTERALPARLAPPRSPEGTLVVLIVDKSSSMEGRKMELARLAAIGVIDNLRPVDLVGILIFDNSFQWAVPVRKSEDKTLIKRLVAGIMPDGGTQIAPALAEAYRRALPVKATFKHIVLLTDGISEEGDSLSLAKEAATQSVTISTVGLGQDVNRAFLEKVALHSKGKAYFLTDPSGLEQILLRDVMEHTGSTAVEKLVQPVVMKQAEILAGVGMEGAPPLKGYVKFTAKPTADTLLTIERKDPLLVRWQYGLGRSAVFTSDAKSRWADAWVRWSGFDHFWSNVFRDLLPHAQAGETTAEFDSVSGELVVTYRVAPVSAQPALPPAIYVFGPDGFQRTVEVRGAADGVFRGRVPIGARRGLFRLRPLEESRAFSEVGYYRQEEELAEYGSNDLLLRQISEYTGGRFNPEPRRIFDTGGRSVPGSLRLWPGLLALAILLNFVELVLRKWRGIFARRQAPATA
jgi:Mg-chelatase subunit ChlD